MMRTHRPGELRAEHIGTRTAICGWVAHRRDHGGVAFLDVRDATGLLQVVVDPGQAGLDAVKQVRNEWVLRIEGEIKARPDGTVNDSMPTGQVELVADSLEVLSESEPPPFPLDDRVDVDETLRLRHRYLDLRRAPMQQNLRNRALVNKAMRAAMDDQDFVEIETPMLIASTPEGARDFVVPSRLHHGSFYALPQSPQLFKQLLMVGGFDRYYQIARCLRDEDLRSDRQFEFMQLDIEMTFASQFDVQAAITQAVIAAANAVRPGAAPSEIPSMTWLEAMSRFGNDKPDMRFGMELTDLGTVFAETEFRAFAGAASVKGVCVNGQGEVSRNVVDGLVDRAKQLGAAGLVWMRVREVEGATTLESPVVKFLSESEQAGILRALLAEVGDLVLIAAGDWHTTVGVLGQLRLDLGRPAVTEGGLQFVWVVDFPLFDGVNADGAPISAHHPFTMPHEEDLDKLESDPLSVRSQAYDLVVNGWELGSGSVRIHRRDVQARIFAMLGISEAEQQQKFGFLLDAFRFGPPPHAGFAVGIDRFVAIMSGEENIREVIAFPKTQSGADPMTNAPSAIEEVQLRELGLTIRRPPAKA